MYIRTPFECRHDYMYTDVHCCCTPDHFNVRTTFPAVLFLSNTLIKSSTAAVRKGTYKLLPPFRFDAPEHNTLTAVKGHPLLHQWMKMCPKSPRRVDMHIVLICSLRALQYLMSTGTKRKCCVLRRPLCVLSSTPSLPRCIAHGRRLTGTPRRRKLSALR